MAYGSALTGNAASGRNTHVNSLSAGAAGARSTAAKSARKVLGEAIVSGAWRPSMAMGRLEAAIAIIDTGATVTDTTVLTIITIENYDKAWN